MTNAQASKTDDRESKPDAPGTSASPVASHGAGTLPAVHVDSYNLELRDPDGFIGDRASKRAFRTILDEWRERMARASGDPLGNEPTKKLSKKKLDKLLASDNLEAAGLLHGVIEEFAGELVVVLRRFLRETDWADTERIIVGGGFRQSRLGELAIGRTMVMLKADGHNVELLPIRHHPDEAGLIGAMHLVPSWIFKGHAGLLAVDIGGTNLRAGVVELNADKAPDLSKAAVARSELWTHRDDEPNRTQFVNRLFEVLVDLVKYAKKQDLRLAPFIGVGCPGIIAADGSIKRGGQNLPGNWEEGDFNLPAELTSALPEIDGERTEVVMHNDAVVQGLSEVPFMKDVARWGVITIGTGLGNARFTNIKD